MNQQLLYEKYKKYLKTDLTNVKIYIGEEVLVLNFHDKRAYYSKIENIDGNCIICGNIYFNRQNIHGYADFIPTKLLLENKVLKLLNI